MATEKEEKEEQAFFAEKVKEQNEMDKHTKDAEKEKESEDTFRDSLGQPNPAHEFQLKAIAEEKQQEEREKAVKRKKKAAK
jgi:hypothetical protein